MNQLVHLSPARLAAMTAMGRYRFLTARHCVTLGISQSEASARNNILNPLLEDGFTKARNLGSQPGYQLPRLHYLTPLGAKLLAEQLQMPLDAVSYPKGPVSVVSDIPHLLATIDVHMALRLWANRAHTDGIEVAAYFEKTGSQRHLNQQARTRINVAFDNRQYKEPDLLVVLRREAHPVVYCVEVHRKTETGRVFAELSHYRRIIEDGWAQRVHASPWSNFVLSIHHNRTVMQSLCRLMHEAPEFAPFKTAFLFNHIDEVREDASRGWMLLDGSSVRPFA